MASGPSAAPPRPKRLNASETARVFKVLSVETRVRLVELLKARSRCVNALARALGVTPAAVSQHLRVLRDAGLVTAERRGYFIHYQLNHETLSAWGERADLLLSGRIVSNSDDTCASAGETRAGTEGRGTNGRE